MVTMVTMTSTGHPAGGISLTWPLTKKTHILQLHVFQTTHYTTASLAKIKLYHSSGVQAVLRCPRFPTHYLDQTLARWSRGASGHMS